MKNTSKKIVSNTQARVRLPTENEAPTGEGMRLSGYRTKNAFFSISNLRKPKSIAVTSRNSLVWTVLHIKYNMGSKREDPKCCKPRIKYTIWINAFQNFLGIEKIGNQENLICFCSSKQGNPLLAVTGIGWHSVYVYIYLYILCVFSFSVWFAPHILTWILSFTSVYVQISGWTLDIILDMVYMYFSNIHIYIHI